MSVLAEVEHKGKKHNLILTSFDRLYLTAIDKKDFKRYRIDQALPVLVSLGIVIAVILAWIFLPQWGLGVVDFRDGAPAGRIFGSAVLFFLTIIVGALFLSALLHDFMEDFKYFHEFKDALSKNQSLADYCYYGPAKNDFATQNILIHWKDLDPSKDNPEQNIAIFVEWFKDLSKEDQQKFLLESLEANDTNKAAQNLQELSHKNGGNEALKKDIQNKLRVTNEKIDELEYKRKVNTAVIVNWHMNQNMLKALTD